MNPQQPEDTNFNPAQPETQTPDVPLYDPAGQQPSATPIITALPPEDHTLPQPSIVPEPAVPGVQLSRVKRLKKVLITVAVLVVLAVLIPVIITILGSPKLQQTSSETAIKNDVSILASELNKYKNTAGTYPAAAQFYDGTFKPEGVTFLNSSDSVNYVPTPASCDAKAVPCAGFTLTTKLDSGKEYSVSN
jgi:hypothetical protein